MQERLKANWGGLPTELLLSWSDTTIEAPTKHAYHKALQRFVPDIALPGPKEEQADRAAAMDRYRAAVRRLIEARRGPAHHLILNENISFGFWRNMLGMRWIAILLALFSMVALVLAWRLGVIQPTMLAPSCVRRTPVRILDQAGRLNWRFTACHCEAERSVIGPVDTV